MTIRFDAVPPLDPKVAAFAGGKHAMLVIQLYTETNTVAIQRR